MIYSQVSFNCIIDIDEKFDPKKIITIQDPKNPGRNISQYHFKQNNEDITKLVHKHKKEDKETMNVNEA